MIKAPKIINYVSLDIFEIVVLCAVGSNEIIQYMGHVTRARFDKLFSSEKQYIIDVI